MFPTVWVKVWELRTDITTWIVYRYNGTTWIVNGSGTPSSAWFPVVNIVTWEVREDILTGRKYLWDGSAWVLQANTPDANQDGKPDVANTVDDLAITTAKLAALAVTKAKLALVSTDVTVALWQTVGTATVATGSIVVGMYPKTNQDQLIDSVVIASTTLTVTLAAAATADNVFTVTTIA